jgi:hypothetical protein
LPQKIKQIGQCIRQAAKPASETRLSNHVVSTRCPVGF